MKPRLIKLSVLLCIALALPHFSAQANAPAEVTLAAASAAQPQKPVVLNCGKAAVAGVVSELSSSGKQVHVLVRSPDGKRVVLEERISTSEANNRYPGARAGSPVCVLPH